MRYEIAALTLLVFSLVLGAVYGSLFDFSDSTGEHAKSYVLFALVIGLTTMLSFISVPVLVVWGILS